MASKQITDGKKGLLTIDFGIMLLLYPLQHDQAEGANRGHKTVGRLVIKQNNFQKKQRLGKNEVYV